jgi:outer membrane protein assembly factor BamB
VYVWNLATRGVTKLGRKTHCEQTSTGNAIAALSIAGTRVLWVHYAGGNIREWSLWTATWKRPQPRLIRFVARDVDLPPPIVLGPGDLTRLAYAVDRTVIALDANGARRFTWTAPARVSALAVFGGGTWVALDGGALYELNERGRPLEFPPLDGNASAIVVDGLGSFAQVGRLIEARIGGTTETYAIPAGGRLVDAAASRALWVAAGRVGVHDFSSGRDLSVVGTAAAIEDRSLLVGSGRRITIRPLP